MLTLVLQVRLAFKPESQQLWIASATSTQKREYQQAAQSYRWRQFLVFAVKLCFQVPPCAWPTGTA